MNYERNLAQGLVDEILEAVYKYSESITVATAIGCLEIAKTHLLTEQLEGEDEE